MMMPVPPRSQSPLTQLTTSPRTCVEMIATASLHPQRRRRNHPIPARDEGYAEQQKENPHRASQRSELHVRSRIKNPDTIKSSASPEQGSCSETRHDGTKEQENAYRCKSRRLRPDSESRLVRFGAPHPLNIGLRCNP
jgi:hypothetical protein